MDSWDGRRGGGSSKTGLPHADEEGHGDGAEVMIVIDSLFSYYQELQ